MVWKQDLAQFKQQMKPDQEPIGPPPKPVPPPLPKQSLEDADLLFLRAMGGVAVPPVPATSTSLVETGKDSPQEMGVQQTSNTVSRVLSAEESSGDFSQALGELKGLRPLAINPVFSASSPSVPASPALAMPPPSTINEQVSTQIPADGDALELSSSHHTGIAEIPVATQEVPHARPGPVLMHLAAGMAIEVDGTLDLRRHSLNDAKERLKERIRDGLVLHWRTLLVMLGPNEALKQGFLAFLTTPQAQSIDRYAQAPVPMGGAQAWVLYLNQQVQPTRKDNA